MATYQTPPSLGFSRQEYWSGLPFPSPMHGSVKNESEVVQLCQTLYDPMDHSLPGSSIHGIFQARVLEWEHCIKEVILLISFHRWGHWDTQIIYLAQSHTLDKCLSQDLNKMNLILTFVSTTILSIWQRGVRIDPVMYDKSLITKTVVLE